MYFSYSGTYWLNNQSEFRFSGMNDYICAVKKKMSESFYVPEYVAADERAMLTKVYAELKNNPWKMRRQFNDALEAIQNDCKGAEPVSYGSYRNLYELCVFAVRVILGEEVNPMIYTAPFVYNAFATCYLDKVWIYISEYFFKDIFTKTEIDMYCDEEIVALVGHELGHAACQHIMIKLSREQGTGINDEYSADRAGLIACAKYIMHKDPDISVEDATKKAVVYMASMLGKITIAVTALTKKKIVNWNEYNKIAFDNLKDKVENIFSANIPANPYNSSSTHPIDEHRIMALVYFSVSECYYRCIGLDPSNYSNLLSDKMLENDMSRLTIK